MFSRRFSTFNQLKIDKLDDILPPDIKVVIGNDPELLKTADVVVIDLPIIRHFLKPGEELVKQDNQIWAAWNLECDENYPWMLTEKIQNFFDIWMTYHVDADVFLPYFIYGYKEQLFCPTLPKDDDKKVCLFISSPVNKSRRQEYLEELMKHIKVDSYGKFLNNCKISDDKGYSSKMQAVRKYKFTIAFENAVGNDYVTEKFYEPLLAGSVPIYMGAPNIEKFSPGKNSFINVANYPDPRYLAARLNEYCNNNELYNNLLAWKNYPLTKDFASLIETQKNHPFIRLAESVQDLKKQDQVPHQQYKNPRLTL